MSRAAASLPQTERVVAPARRRRRRRRGVASAALLLLAVLWSQGCSVHPPQEAAPAEPQRALLEPSQAQVELNRMAIVAVDEGKPDKALELFTAALSLGELNVTWLNLGRLHASQGRCDEARLAYDNAARAPMVPSPPPEEIAQTLARYRQELVEEQCAATLWLRCDPPGMEIFLDDRTLRCPDEPLRVAWGRHQVVWSVRGLAEPVLRYFDIGPGQTLELVIDAGHAPDTLTGPATEASPGSGETPH